MCIYLLYVARPIRICISVSVSIGYVFIYFRIVSGTYFIFRLKYKMQEMDVLTNKRREHVFTHVYRYVCVCIYELNTKVQQISPVLYFYTLLHVG